MRLRSSSRTESPRVWKSMACALLCATLTACGVGGVAAFSGGGGGGGAGEPPPRVDLDSPTTDPTSNFVTLRYRLVDRSVGARAIVEITPEYRVVYDVAKVRVGPWHRMTQTVGQRAAGSSPPPADERGATASVARGGEKTFLWNSLVDLPRQNGDVQVRLNARYASTKLRRSRGRFRSPELRFELDNRRTTTILLATDDVVAPGVDDVRFHGDSLLVASRSAARVESVGADGAIEVVAGGGFASPVAVLGTEALGPLARAAAILPERIAVARPGVFYMLNSAQLLRGFPTFDGSASPLLVVNTNEDDVDLGFRVVGAGRVESLGDRPPRLAGDAGPLRWYEPAKVLLFTTGSGRRGDPLTLRAFNPSASESVMLVGVTIEPGGVGWIAGGGSDDKDHRAARETSFISVSGIAVGPDGEIYYSESSDAANRVRVINAGGAELTFPTVSVVSGKLVSDKFSVAPGTVATVAGGRGFGGTGQGEESVPALADKAFVDPSGLAISPSRELFIGDGDQVKLVNLGEKEIMFADRAVGPGELARILGGQLPSFGEGAVGHQFDLPDTFLEGGMRLAYDPDRRLLAVAAGTGVAVLNGADPDTDDGVAAFGKVIGAGRVAIPYVVDERPETGFVAPRALALLRPDTLLVADEATIRSVDLARGAGEVRVVAGIGVPGFEGDGLAAADAQFDRPSALAVVDGGLGLFVADSQNHRVRFINLDDEPTEILGRPIAAGAVDTVVGLRDPGQPPDDGVGDGGPPDEALLLRPEGVALMNHVPTGTPLLWVADTGHHRIRCVNLGNDAVTIAGVTIDAGTIRTIVGDGIGGFDEDGPPPSVDEQWRVNSATALAVDGRLGVLYFADTGNSRVRALNAGPDPVELALLRVEPGHIVTLIGTGQPGNSGDGLLGPSALINEPRSVFVRPGIDNTNGEPTAGVLLVSDAASNVVRMLNLTDRSLESNAGPTGPGRVATAGSIVSYAGAVNTQGLASPPAFAGDGDFGSATRFSTPLGVIIVDGLVEEEDQDGNVEETVRPTHVFVADSANNRLRRLGPPGLDAR